MRETGIMIKLMGTGSSFIKTGNTTLEISRMIRLTVREHSIIKTGPNCKAISGITN